MMESGVVVVCGSRVDRGGVEESIGRVEWRPRTPARTPVDTVRNMNAFVMWYEGVRWSIHSFYDTMWWRFPFPVPGLDFLLPERNCGNTRVLLTRHCKRTVVLAVSYFLLLWIFVAFSGSAPEETLVCFASQGLDILPYKYIQRLMRVIYGSILADPSGSFEWVIAGNPGSLSHLTIVGWVLIITTSPFSGNLFVCV